MSEEIKRPELRDPHTAENTTMKETVAPVLPKAAVQTEATEGTTMHIMLGTSKVNFEPMMRLVMHWSRYEAAIAENVVSKAELTRLKSVYDEHRKEMYGDKDEEEVKKLMSQFLAYNRNFVELSYYRNAAMVEREWENQSMIANGKTEGDIVPRFPGSKNEAMALRDKMMRSSKRKSRRPNGYDVLLRDSFVQVRLEPSDMTELGMLIDRINRQIHGYVTSFNGNSMTLIRASIYRVFWEYISEKIISHSVTDIDEPRDLSPLIRLSDLRALFAELLAELQQHGFPTQIYCNQNGCDWSEFMMVDATNLLWHDKDLLNLEQAAALGNLKNFAAKYTREEVLALQAQYNFVEDPTFLFDDGNQQFRMAQPSISEYFLAFDVFMEYIGPAIRELRGQNVDDKEFETRLQVLIDTVRGLEYLHWVSELTIFPDEGSDEEPQVFTRAENPLEFFNGLIGIINEDDDVTAKLIRWCVQNGPAMSATVVGMSNAVCPKCGKETHGGVTARGITPFDPFMSFFTQTRQAIQETAIRRGILEPNTL